MLSRWECQHYGTSTNAVDGITNLGRQLSLVDLCDIVVRTLTVSAQFRVMTGGPVVVCLIIRSVCGWMHQRWLSALGLIPTKNKECCLLLTTPKLTFHHREVYFPPKASMSIVLLNFGAFFNGFRGCGTTFSAVHAWAGLFVFVNIFINSI